MPLKMRSFRYRFPSKPSMLCTTSTADRKTHLSQSEVRLSPSEVGREFSRIVRDFCRLAHRHCFITLRSSKPAGTKEPERSRDGTDGRSSTVHGVGVGSSCCRGRRGVCAG